jgi:hypothetical protein
MKNLFGLIILLLIIIGGVGFYLSWFHFSTTSTGQSSHSATISVDEEKIREDEKTAKNKMHEFVHKVDEKTSDHADKVHEPERSP